MTILLASLIDATIILGFGLALTVVLRRQSAAVRHAVLTAAIGCAIVMPALELMVPQLPVVHWIDSAVTTSSELSSSTEAPPVVTLATTGETPSSRAVSWPMLVAGAWTAGAVITFIGFATSLWRLRRLRASCTLATGTWRDLTDELAHEYRVPTRVKLLQSDDPTLLATYGMFNPGIILPAGAGDWTLDRQRIVLRHELAHIRRCDAAIQVAGELLRVMQPFNPLVWVACQRLRQESEYACDDAVLCAGVEATDYATHLLDIAKRLSGRQTIWASAPAIAHPSTLERRIVAMLHHQKNRQSLSPRGWTLAAVLALGLSLPLAAVGIAPQPVTAPNSPVATLPSTPLSSLGSPSKVVASTTVVPPPRVTRLAQTTFSGQLQDQTGGRLPGATVTVINQQTQEPYEAVTNAAGVFRFVNLPRATYELVAQLNGFRRVRVPIDLSTSTPANVTLTLPIGAMSEELSVVCKAPSSSILQMFFPTLSAQEPPSSPIRVGGTIRAPRKTKDARPVCPAGEVPGEVVVVLEGHIGVDGLITDIKSVSGEGAEFIESAKDAALKWEFTPTLLNGVPVEVTITVTVRFTRA